MVAASVEWLSWQNLIRHLCVQRSETWFELAIVHHRVFFVSCPVSEAKGDLQKLKENYNKI